MLNKRGLVSHNGGLMPLFGIDETKVLGRVRKPHNYILGRLCCLFINANQYGFEYEIVAQLTKQGLDEEIKKYLMKPTFQKITRREFVVTTRNIMSSTTSCTSKSREGLSRFTKKTFCEK